MINGANAKSSEHDRPHAYVTRSCLPARSVAGEGACLLRECGLRKSKVTLHLIQTL